ncbi:putative inorganic phosphate cotransporter isoform X2 [Anthonomus grandis grandis]|uniref:putative inorganic phosphate cotransporter isoform X2 n=1 Tax=Anthonomus grandis grandis TaxID=2921223 RepID=UPI002164F40D|nr:putative inorganic phosphate cotransporter isoform X2 [Anthonomus grandis grandis]
MEYLPSKGTSASWIKVRYIQMVLLFFLMAASYAIRTILSVAIVAMTTPNTSTNSNIPTFDWKKTDGVVLSSFYWSYAVLQFFAGPIAHTFSPKLILIIAMLVNAGTCLLIPIFSVYLGISGIIACRVIQGIAQGFIIPLTHNMLGKWAPTEERSWINTSVYSGCSFGTIISMPITGYLSSSSLGWPASFYFFGILGMVWIIFWIIFGADKPATHKSISLEEQKYIEGSLGQEEDDTLMVRRIGVISNITIIVINSFKNKNVPWKAIFTSLPYWAVIMGAIGESWGGTFLITEIPSYLGKVTDIDIEKNSLYSSAPYVVAAVLTLFYGPLADYLILKQITSRKTSRRLFHGIGAFLPAAALIWLAYEENPVGIAILLIVAISLNGAMFCGHNVNHIDISPRFSGVLFGISNGIGQSLAILAPILVEYVVYDKTDKSLWRTMFIIAAMIYAATALFFIIYLSAERQWWDSASNVKMRDLEARDLEKSHHLVTSEEL